MAHSLKMSARYFFDALSWKKLIMVSSGVLCFLKEGIIRALHYEDYSGVVQESWLVLLSHDSHIRYCMDVFY